MNLVAKIVDRQNVSVVDQLVFLMLDNELGV